MVGSVVLASFRQGTEEGERGEGRREKEGEEFHSLNSKSVSKVI
jgi:hypothetical protein